MSGDAPTRLEQQLKASLARLGLSPEQQTKEVPVTEPSTALVRSQANFSLTVNTFTEAMEIAAVLAKSSFVPECYRGDPGAVFAAMMMASELRIGIMQGLQGIAVINGRPSVWGDLALALCMTHPEYDGHVEEMKEDGSSAKCTMKRKGRVDVVRYFSLQDAQDAGLLRKQGPWQTARKRMLQMRARAFAMRDQFADALRGVGIREETEDYAVTAQVIGSQPVANDTPMPVAEVAPVAEAAKVKAAPERPQPTAAKSSPVLELVQSSQSLSDFMVPSGTNAGKRMRDLKDSTLEWYASQCKDPQIMAAATFERTRREKLRLDADRKGERVDADGVVHANDNGAAE